MIPEARIDTSKEELTRRRLLKLFGGGILVFAFAPESFGTPGQQRGGESGARGQASAIPQVIGAWVHVALNGDVTVYTGKVEVGQNARTSLTQAVAEELRVPAETVRITMGDTDLVPFDMGTFGSMTTPRMVPQVRRAAAAARETLVDLAAQQWGCAKSVLSAEGGKVICMGPPRSVTYGELAKGQPLDKPIDRNVVLTEPTKWKVLGKSAPKVGATEMVTGRHLYTSDLTRPGMLHAKVLRPPSFGAKLLTVDTAAAAAMAGVQVVHDGDFVAVAAPTDRLARRALQAVHATWAEKPGASSKDLVTVLRGPAPTLTAPPAGVVHRSTYTCAFIAHTPLEPRAALAEWDGKRMTVHTGTQRPFGVRPEVAAALGIPESQVRVLVPDTGSGYGGKHTGDAAVEAARIARATGHPVKVVWTRVEEFTFAYFRPGGVADICSGVGKDGTLTHWEAHTYNAGAPGIATPYDVRTPHTEAHDSSSPLRQGSYRALGSTFNHFARETHMDEIAHGVGIDPLAFRLKNLAGQPRIQAVLKAAAERFGWGKAVPAGHGFGLACGTEKGGHVATVVEVAVDVATKEVRVVRAVTAFDCGAVLNPDLLKNQVEGAVIMGIGGALFEEIEFADGKILNPHLSRYRVPRYPDIPRMETILLDRKELPSAGAGECPIIATAPAIGNAIFAASGVRLRSMPLRLSA